MELPGRQINDTSLGKRYFLPFHPATPLSPFRTLERLFELHSLHDSPYALLPELQIIKDAFGGAALVAEVPGHPQVQLTQTLIASLLKNTCLCCSEYRRGSGVP